MFIATNLTSNVHWEQNINIYPGNMWVCSNNCFLSERGSVFYNIFAYGAYGVSKDGKGYLYAL